MYKLGIKSKVVPMQAMKGYWGKGGITPFILVSTRWRWAFNITPQLLYPLEITLVLPYHKVV